MRSAPGEGGCGTVATVCIGITPRWAAVPLPRAADWQGRRRRPAKAQLRRPCHPRGRVPGGSPFRRRWRRHDRRSPIRWALRRARRSRHWWRRSAAVGPAASCGRAPRRAFGAPAPSACSRIDSRRRHHFRAPRGQHRCRRLQKNNVARHWRVSPRNWSRPTDRSFIVRTIIQLFPAKCERA